ncbi:hypothetical protein CLF_102330 [Clonorchis sinensis]|uniref:Uncharacterized protein n=1 Tax=Clonorchis sinensis TaxID=79923 RepID=G7Y7P2_CLOSI|nr:hypothetical protein CLF_102330 [Clonorchis sinensis]
MCEIEVGREYPGTDENLVDLEYEVDIVLIFEEEKAQLFLDELTKFIPSFGMHFAPTKCETDENLVDLEYEVDIVLIFEEEKAQLFLDELTKFIPSFGMHFAPTKCEVMPVEMSSMNTPLTIQG